MDHPLALIIVALIGIIVPFSTLILKVFQDRATARELAATLQARKTEVDSKLEEIHILVNSRLSKALKEISILRAHLNLLTQKGILPPHE